MNNPSGIFKFLLTGPYSYHKIWVLPAFWACSYQEEWRQNPCLEAWIKTERKTWIAVEEKHESPWIVDGSANGSICWVICFLRLSFGRQINRSICFLCLSIWVICFFRWIWIIYPLEGRIYKSQIWHNFNIYLLLPPLSMLWCGCVIGFLGLSWIWVPVLSVVWIWVPMCFNVSLSLSQFVIEEAGLD